jgi:hypothetical protein
VRVVFEVQRVEYSRMYLRRRDRGEGSQSSKHLEAAER